MSADVLDLPIPGSTSDSDESTSNESTPVGPVICYRDPADVRTIRRQSQLIIISFVIAAVAVVGGRVETLAQMRRERYIVRKRAEIVAARKNRRRDQRGRAQRLGAPGFAEGLKDPVEILK